MKIKIYLQDWFYNAGLIGFHRIFKDKSKLVINDNYIELESDSLLNFADDYFEYFFNQYNVAEKTMQRIENNLKIIKQNLEKEPITKEERNRIVKILKNFEITIGGFRPVEEAIVTAGGISTKEINPKTFECKTINNLYFIGEVLDVDALSGGFNLQIAFSTGYACAKSIVNKI